MASVKSEIEEFGRLLGLNEADIIKFVNGDTKVYHKLAMKYHPDHNPDNDVADVIFRTITLIMGLK